MGAAYPSKGLHEGLLVVCVVRDAKQWEPILWPPPAIDAFGEQGFYVCNLVPFLYIVVPRSGASA